MLSADKKGIARGFATGVAISFTPFVGFHTLIALSISHYTHQNKTASVFGTLTGNPWTFPLIWYLDWQTGCLIAHNIEIILPKDISIIFKEAFSALITLDFSVFFADIWPIYKVVLIGCIPYCIITWVLMSHIVAKMLIKIPLKGEIE